MSAGCEPVLGAGVGAAVVVATGRPVRGMEAGFAQAGDLEHAGPGRRVRRTGEDLAVVEQDCGDGEVRGGGRAPAHCRAGQGRTDRLDRWESGFLSVPGGIRGRTRWRGRSGRFAVLEARWLILRSRIPRCAVLSMTWKQSSERSAIRRRWLMPRRHVESSRRVRRLPSTIAEHQALVDPDAVLLTTSTSEAYSFLFRLLCDPGDAVLVAQPSYPLVRLPG